MATAHIYIRCSHIDSAESGLGLMQQEETCRAYFDLLRLRVPDCRELLLNQGIFRDVAVSAYQRKSAAFDKRPAGRRLLGEVKPGDHILFARLDRSFRNARECRRWIDHWKDTGVRVHFVDLQVDVGTAQGMLIVGIMSYMAEWQSAYISERTREGQRQKILKLGDVYAEPPIGSKKVVDENGVPRYERDHRRRVRVRWVRWLLDVVSPRLPKPLTHPQVCELYERCEAKRQNREPYRAASRFTLKPNMVGVDYKAAARIWPERYLTEGRKSG